MLGVMFGSVILGWMLDVWVSTLYYINQFFLGPYASISLIFTTERELFVYYQHAALTYINKCVMSTLTHYGLRFCFNHSFICIKTPPNDSSTSNVIVANAKETMLIYRVGRRLVARVTSVLYSLSVFLIIASPGVTVYIVVKIFSAAMECGLYISAFTICNVYIHTLGIGLLYIVW